MDTRVDPLLFLIFIFFSGLVGCCRICLPSPYYSKATSEIMPKKDTVHVGDTLWYSSRFPTDMILPDSSIVDFSGAENVIAGVNLDRIPNKGTIEGALQSFFIIQGSGRVVPNVRDSLASTKLDYSELNGFYEVSFGLVAKIPAFFC